jgi:hypothetical protein
MLRQATTASCHIPSQSPFVHKPNIQLYVRHKHNILCHSVLSLHTVADGTDVHSQLIAVQPVVATTVYTPVREAGNLKSKNDVISERLRFKHLGNWTRSCGVFVCLFVCNAVVCVSAGRSGSAAFKRTSSCSVMWTDSVQLHTDNWPCGADNTDVLFAVWHNAPASIFVCCKSEPVSRCLRGLLAEPESWPRWLQDYFSLPPSGI